ncbi:hypothetical protein Q5752_003241 [Cryptotrichosporon argae]
MSTPSTTPPKVKASSPAAPGPSSSTAAADKSVKAGAKSAKELKKEKRAAAVAARGADDPAVGSTSASASGPGARGGGKPSAAGGPGAGPSTHARRPDAALAKPKPAPAAAPEPDPAQTFFSHLPVQRAPSSAAAFDGARLHPLVVRLGLLMSSGALRGANARTAGTMEAFRAVIRDYESSESTVLWKDLPAHLSPMIAWLETCRPKGVGGGNAIRWLKSEINRLGEQDGMTEDEQKTHLMESISIYLRDRIEFAGQVIADNAKEKIKPGDTVVVYARSSVVERALLEAWRDMQAEDASLGFSIIVVDSRPLLEGRLLLDSLTSAGLACTYVLLPLLSPLLPHASLVLLGGSALHSDGALFARAGTAMVAMLANEHRVPVVACVETYKFGERVALDAVASNELGSPDALRNVPARLGRALRPPPQSQAQAQGQAQTPKDVVPLHLVYDLTPPSLITAVCTEIGFIPPSSVPTVLGKTSGAA